MPNPPTIRVCAFSVYMYNEIYTCTKRSQAGRASGDGGEAEVEIRCTSCTLATEVIRVRPDVNTVTFDKRTPLHLLATRQPRHGSGMQTVMSAGLALAVEALAAGINCENKVTFSERSYAHSSMNRYVFHGFSVQF